MTETTSARSQNSRMLDPGTPPTRYARGWHCLGMADSFRDGKPHTIHAFGNKLVVWADSKGKLNVIDAYCRHMGGDLSQGTVKGDEIACPFHDWRWGGDGACKQIPYARRVPMRARTRTWYATERNKQLFIWHDHEGNPPIQEQMVPELTEMQTGEWSDMVWKSLDIPGVNCREIIDNIVDMAHFFYIHGAFPTYFKNVFEGHVAAQYMNSEPRPDLAPDPENMEDNTLESEAAYYGPSYMINPLKTSYHGMEINAILINCHYPVTQDHFILQFGLMVKRPEGVDEATGNIIASKFSDLFAKGFMQDVWIWQNKSPVQNPLLSEEDGPVYQLRRWYEQYYVDVADITPEMTERFEFEVNTTYARENWDAEVAENLARKKAESAAQ